MPAPWRKKGVTVGEAAARWAGARAVGDPHPVGPNVWPAGWYLSIEGTDRVLAHGSEDAGGDGRRPPFPRNTVDPTGHRSG